jgi:hypothetical protein
MILRQVLPMVFTRVALSSVLVLAVAAPCLAASQAVIPDALQQEAMTCVGEALQICPDVWTAEDHGLACMTGKRAFFSPRCRVIYDKVDQVLHPASSKFVSRHDHARSHAVQ